MKFVAAGDAIIQRRIQSDFEGYDELAPIISDADASFFNLETTLNEEGEARCSRLSGGTYLRTTPRVLEDLEKFGFNMTSFNNNHSLDYFYDGFEATLDYLNASSFVHAGAGMNLAEASAPKYLETKNGRVALISVNTTHNPTMIAGVQTERIAGRPGINALNVESYVSVNEEEMAFIKKLAEKTMINASKIIVAKEGYEALPNENEENLGDLKFVVGEKTEYISKIKQADLDRVKKAIFEAKLQADYIMVSIHSHQLSGDKKENPSQFLIDFAHMCIDEGANAVVGHGPHLLRPIEVYKDCPIFYSLGDFILQLYNVEFAPEEFFSKFGLPHNSTVHELLKKRSRDFTVGLMTDRRMFISALPVWETDENGKMTSLKLVPVEAKMDGNKSQMGLPRICDADAIFDYISEMSAPFGTTFEKDENGFITCKW